MWDFTLTDQNGVKRSISEFRGNYVLIYFGYTSCNGVCHMMLRNISQALKIMENNLDRITPIFITINPERDTSNHLKNYAKNLHPKFITLTGTPEQVTAVLEKYKIYQFKVEADETMLDPLIEHSTLAYLFDQEGVLVKLFDQSISPTRLANEVKALFEEEKKKLN